MPIKYGLGVLFAFENKVLEIVVHRGKFITGFDIPKDFFCTLAPKKVFICLPTSEEQYTAERQAHITACISAVFASIAGAALDFFGPLKALLGIAAASWSALWPDNFSLRDPEARTIITSTHWLRWLIQHLHYAVSSSAALYQQDAIEAAAAEATPTWWALFIQLVVRVEDAPYGREPFSF